MMNMTATLPVGQLLHEAGEQLSLRCIAGESGLDRIISVARIQKPGLALAGYAAQVKPGRLQVIGRTEINYLETLGESVAAERLRAFFSLDLPGVVVTSGLSLPDYGIALAEAAGVPLLSSRLVSSLFMARVADLLQRFLAERTSVHGVLVDVNGVGILILGKSGIGKSECALDLVIRGHRLVADDVVEISKPDEETLVGRAAELIRHLMEVRGLGIINIKDLFGISSVREEKRIELVAELTEWNPEEEYDRLGIDDPRYKILGVEIPYHLLPVRPGRSMTSILEIAARNHLLKLQGHHSAREFQERLARGVSEVRGPLAPRGRAE
jgi:HPr kinase/phosphorylase